MRLAPAAFLAALLLWPAPAAAYEVVREEEAGADRVMALLAKVCRAYPGLCASSNLTKVVLRRSGERGELHFECEGKAMTLDPKLVFETRSAPGVYKPGSEPESIVFHELLHGLGCTPGAREEEVSALEKAYAAKVSGSRARRFVAEYTRGQRAATNPSTRRQMALLRLASREEVLAEFAHDPEYQARAAKRYDRIAAQMTIEEARAISREEETETRASLKEHARLLGLAADGMTTEQLAKAIQAEIERDPRKAEEAGARHREWYQRNTAMGREQAREREETSALLAKHRIPRRNPNDIHAAEKDGIEWFTYGGEFYFYAASPADYLTPEESAFWSSMTPFLKGQGPLPDIR